MPVSRLVLAGQ